MKTEQSKASFAVKVSTAILMPSSFFWRRHWAFVTIIRPLVNIEIISSENLKEMVIRNCCTIPYYWKYGVDVQNNIKFLQAVRELRQNKNIDIGAPTLKGNCWVAQDEYLNVIVEASERLLIAIWRFPWTWRDSGNMVTLTKSIANLFSFPFDWYRHGWEFAKILKNGFGDKQFMTFNLFPWEHFQSLFVCCNIDGKWNKNFDSSFSSVSFTTVRVVKMLMIKSKR